MPTVYDADNFAGRVNYASLVISQRRRTTRSFDTCFEQYDGRAVAAAIWRRSLRNPEIAANLSRYLDPKSCENLFQYYQGRDLNEIARQLRTIARLDAEESLSC